MYECVCVCVQGCLCVPVCSTVHNGRYRRRLPISSQWTHVFRMATRAQNKDPCREKKRSPSRVMDVSTDIRSMKESKRVDVVINGKYNKETKIRLVAN